MINNMVEQRNPMRRDEKQQEVKQPESFSLMSLF